MCECNGNLLLGRSAPMTAVVVSSSAALRLSCSFDVYTGKSSHVHMPACYSGVSESRNLRALWDLEATSRWSKEFQRKTACCTVHAKRFTCDVRAADLAVMTRTKSFHHRARTMKSQRRHDDEHVKHISPKEFVDKVFETDLPKLG